MEPNIRQQHPHFAGRRENNRTEEKREKEEREKEKREKEKRRGQAEGEGEGEGEEEERSRTYFGGVRQHHTRVAEVIDQTARSSVRSVNGTHKTPNGK